MSKRKSKRRVDVVYSTNPDYNYEDGNEEGETLVPSEQYLKIHYEKKGRGGKEASIVRGFVGQHSDLNDLAKTLKSKCGVGGSAKDGEIIIQGNQREKMMILLEKMGYNVKKAGG